MIQRRIFVSGSLAVLALPMPGRAAQTATQSAIAHLERQNGGRLGVFATDTASGRTVGYRANERFAMCSTFKFPLGAAILSAVDAKRERLDRPIAYTKSDLLDYAPVTGKNVDKGSMTVGELCAAAIEESDNTAANLLLASIGGPAALTRFLRRTGDPVTRLDRNEPALNSAAEGDPRDTTTPAAMCATARRLLLGNVLSPSSRAQLQAWMFASTTGGERLRAGLPKSWRVGDKTGTGENRAANDVAIAYPPKRAPILLAVYYTGSPKATDRNAVHANVARIVARTFAPTST